MFLAKSLAERNAIVGDYREISKTTTPKKRPEIMDVNQHAVEATMRQHGVHRLIHGHTHRPAQHVFDLDGGRTAHGTGRLVRPRQRAAREPPEAGSWNNCGRRATRNSESGR